MANEEHLNILRQGVDVWNQWRKEHSEIEADLSEVFFTGANFSGVNLSYANLTSAVLNDADLYNAQLVDANCSSAYLSRVRLIQANLSEAILSGTNFAEADLSEANLSYADLSGANLMKATCADADFNRATLYGANLSGANLSRVDFTRADLREANFRAATLNQTKLKGATLLQAFFGGTIITDVDLKLVTGLDAIRHAGPSPIGIDTIYWSQGKISKAFLRGAGVPEDFITYMNELTSEYYKCFISYSSKDEEFASKLYKDLQEQGVRCFYAPEDIKIGDPFRQRIDKEIREHDKLLLVLSEQSVASRSVEHEVEAAFEQEKRQGRQILFPIRVDDAVRETDQAWAAAIRRERHIGDFTQWEINREYQKAFTRLLRDLKASESEGAGTP